MCDTERIVGLTLGVWGKGTKNCIIFLTQTISSQLQLPCKKWSLAVHWWHLTCDDLSFQDHWVSSLPETHWVTPPAMGNFSPCPGTWHCQPLSWSLQSHSAFLPQTVSFSNLPWIAALDGLVLQHNFISLELWLHYILFLSVFPKPFLMLRSPVWSSAHWSKSYQKPWACL